MCFATFANSIGGNIRHDICANNTWKTELQNINATLWFWNSRPKHCNQKWQPLTPGCKKNAKWGYRHGIVWINLLHIVFIYHVFSKNGFQKYHLCSLENFKHFGQQLSCFFVRTGRCPTVLGRRPTGHWGSVKANGSVSEKDTASTGWSKSARVWLRLKLRFELTTWRCFSHSGGPGCLTTSQVPICCGSGSASNVQLLYLYYNHQKWPSPMNCAFCWVMRFLVCSTTNCLPQLQLES